MASRGLSAFKPSDQVTREDIPILIRDMGPLKDHSQALTSADKYRQRISFIEYDMTMWPQDKKKTKYPYPRYFPIGEFLAGTPPQDCRVWTFPKKSMCTHIVSIVRDIRNKANRQRGIFTRVSDISEEAIKQLRFRKSKGVNKGEVKDYVVEKYMANDGFLNSSKELCPDVTSYIVELLNGIPPFIGDIMKDVKEKARNEGYAYTYKDSLYLLKCLYKAFFRTLIHRLLVQDPTLTIDVPLV